MPPEVEPEKVMVASLIDLPGLLVQSVIGQTPGETVYYYINDHLGTPQKMIDENGAVVWSADYEPFGQAEVAVATVANNFRFPGQSYDQETGLHYNYHRYYEPGIGRYLRTDPSHAAHPLGINIPHNVPNLLYTPQEFNNYSYVQNSPANFTDAFGLIIGCRPRETASDRGKESGGYCADQIKLRMAEKEDYCLSDRLIFEDCTICCIELSEGLPNSSLVAGICADICQEVLEGFKKEHCCKQQ